MKNKFYKTYKLKKDLPYFKAGLILKWDHWFELYTEYGPQVGLNNLKPKLKYTKNDIESKKDWFKPMGKLFDFIPAFPSKKDFFDRSNGCGHYLLGNTRHNDMCRICQLLKKIDYAEELKDIIYKILKQKYEKLTK